MGCWGEGGSLGPRLRGPWLGVGRDRALGPRLEEHRGHVRRPSAAGCDLRRDDHGGGGRAPPPQPAPAKSPWLMGGALGAGEPGREERGRVPPELASPARTPRAAGSGLGPTWNLSSGTTSWSASACSSGKALSTATAISVRCSRSRRRSAASPPAIAGLRAGGWALGSAPLSRRGGRPQRAAGL